MFSVLDDAVPIKVMERRGAPFRLAPARLGGGSLRP